SDRSGAGRRRDRADSDRARSRSPRRNDVRAEWVIGRRLGNEPRLRVDAARRSGGALHGNRHVHGNRPMSPTARLFTAALFVLVVAASAGATRARPPIGLTASPAHVVLRGSGTTTVRVTNPGKRAVVVDVDRAGFALDLRGRPRIVRADRRSARS